MEKNHDVCGICKGKLLDANNECNFSWNSLLVEGKVLLFCDNCKEDIRSKQSKFTDSKQPIK
jgi:hypothetical protein